MRIGIITYYRVPNFGANLQALSTYSYLESMGHTPIMIHYMSKILYDFANSFKDDCEQKKAHIDFIDSHFPNQTNLCFSVEEVNQQIKKYNIEGLIIGSDALVQHHPLFERMHFDTGAHRLFRIEYMPPTQLFPNVFWGVGLPDNLKRVMMSVSSQNSKYQYFLPKIKKQMRDSLSHFQYISARDEWTRKMFESLNIPSVGITPDPVFAFNHNCDRFIANESDIRLKFKLKKDYVLVCLRSQSLDISVLSELAILLNAKNIECVALPMPTGTMFSHPFQKEIECPLSPLDWYALIKYSKGYIGSNMHPIIVSLHNSVPCVSIDDWVNTNFWNHVQDDGSSKVEHIMNVFGVKDNRFVIINGACNVTADQIYERLSSFPIQTVKNKSIEMYNHYKKMMGEILSSLEK